MTSLSPEAFQQRYGDTLPIAVIGAGCRMPRADDIFAFWHRLADGEDLIARFDARQLADAGIDPALLSRPGYVPAAAVIEQADRFEWPFFGYSRQEAETIDPQQRIFLMCAWEALEMAGYPSATLEAACPGARIGVLGACKMSSYPAARIENTQEIASPRTFGRLLGNDKDYLATRVSYKLGLTGPSMTVQTACSSSLVAIHLACEQLASGECDMVLAGGAGIGFPQESGYFHREGMIFSPDGLCRPFDAHADGTAIGNGAAVVLLKPLDRALADGDPILAVIRGSSVNNDGRAKAGYTAPSPEGQARVIADALALAEVDPASIHLMEAHGTATPLGDPIEVEALRRAWGGPTAQTQYCALGSVKSNLGHLDTAAGVASFLKAALALHHGQIPPSLHFETPNPALDLASSPFFVPQTLLPWPDTPTPRRAAVSAFAIGGTNCHAILEQAPHVAHDGAAETGLPRLLVLSARSETALRELARRHAWRLDDLGSQVALSDYCATAAHHRSVFDWRLVLVATDAASFIAQLHAFAEQADGQAQAVQAPAGCAVRAWTAGACDDALLAFAREQAVQPCPDWSRHCPPPATRVLLPTCPFEGERCWFEGHEAQQPPASPASEDAPAHWQAAVQAGRHAAATLGGQLDLSGLPREAQGVDALHATYVGQAFAQLGVFADPDAWLDVEACLARGGVPARHRDLLGRLLRDLASAGALDARRIDGRPHYRNLRPRPMQDAQPWLEAMRALGYGQLAPLVERTGPRLADMLTGKRDPVGVVFPGAATDDVEHMYQEQPNSVYLNRIAAATAAALAERRALRILEVGGGTGGTTRDVLAHLPPGACERYTFTDVGPLFLQRARIKFADAPFMQFQIFDMNAPAVAQGLDPAGYDLIVAANVLHNAADLRRMLANLGTVLAPGGVLLMREITAPKKLFDFVFGPLVPPIDDTAARDGELFASEAVWRAALADAGFTRAEALPDRASPAGALGEQILIAHGPVARHDVSTAPVPVPQTAALSGGVRQIDLTVEDPAPGQLIARILAALPEPGRLRLDDLQWRLDSAGAPLPLRLSLLVADDVLHVGIHGTPHGMQPLLRASLARPRALPARLHAMAGTTLGLGDDARGPALLDAALSAVQAPDGRPHTLRNLKSLYWPAPTGPARDARLLRQGERATVCDAGGTVLLAIEGWQDAPPLSAPWRGGEAAGMLYRWRWTPVSAPACATAIRRVTWLGQNSIAERQQLTEAFGCLGIACTFGNPADLLRDETRLPDWLAGADRADAICYAPLYHAQAHAETILDEQVEALRPLAMLVAALGARSDPPRLAVLAPHAFAVEDSDTAAGWQAAGMSGLLAIAQQEYPALQTLLLDSGASAPMAFVPALAAWLACGAVPVGALRGTRHYVQQLIPAAPAPCLAALPPGRHVLIGGLCELGLALADWLAARGARELAILSRKPPTAAQAARLAVLQAQGVDVRLDSRADATEPPAFDAALMRLGGSAPVGCVFHLAGIVRDAPLAAADWRDWQATLATKLVPALALHAREAHLRPAMTVYFSSAASACGPAGQGAHASANAALEGLAHYRSRLGLDTVALAWGFWGDIDAERRRELAGRLAARGMAGLGTAHGMTLMAQAMAGPEPFYLPARIDWPRFATMATRAQAERFGPCWQAAARTDAAATESPARATAQPVDSLFDTVRARVAEVLGRDAQAIPAEANLIQLGLDSLLFLDLSERLGKQFGVSISAETAFKANTLNAFVQALAAQLGLDDAGTDVRRQDTLPAEAPPAAPAALAAGLRQGSGAVDIAAVRQYLRAGIATLLHCAPDTVTDQANLIQLGLDSLLFLELGETIARELDVRISADTAFRAGTFEALADGLAQALGVRRGGTGTQAPAAGACGLRMALTELEQSQGGWLAANGDMLPRPDAPGTPLPLPGLRGLRRQLRESDVPQQLYVEYDKPADFPLARFEQAWNRVVERHPMLRATVSADGLLRILPEAPRTVIAHTDWRGQPAAERDAALAALRETLSRQPFDLAQWPHAEWRASRLDEATLRLHLRLDTTLVDIESLRILLRELFLWVPDPARALAAPRFSARDYYAGEAALRSTDAHARQWQAYAPRVGQLPPPPNLPLRQEAGTGARRFVIWRDALPRDAWLALRAHAEQVGLSGTAALLAAYALALAPWSDRRAFTLRLDYPDRRPVHAQAMNVMLDASASALVPCALDAGSFIALARACAEAIAGRLAADLVGTETLLSAHCAQHLGAGHPARLPPVAMTSLLGVRSAYSIPETSDPLLGMPTHEYASQPDTWLHFQALEEASALLYNIDQRADWLPDELGETVMLRLRLVLDALAESPAAWHAAPLELVPADADIAGFAAAMTRLLDAGGMAVEAVVRD
ncbi:beta-ketoacyl synthase N-terminal-like domain-containing protein [Ralstonia pseudosolanacearum]|uniref:beta-ketoacyl synthase N-terminal-like domain-containing protein n=1 Tax=Ralstonia pseudosolanacearum TaxID=1310165 RepID=UPI00048D8B83|nr:beta-ketoacyl synthase N-terminal-like domain-containing protein [Ralstonia pseudosolanacearum]MDO3558485.1 beta-ketoacyl synthase N-terminal-like domain-containing protein [Ralstonia pseudosolanacearum]MDO3575399.1 beta-ketoacyl synthase N-terminal-like domain-containing protein [Ralstonia pseudosolanacearum]MDO3587991.1 beta-ketoacyl synthase N-terminal-like domain-containing protein [Ralstonia pseudosolanacearum]